jgi:formamidopyrimidine-DNA glycosylase
MQEGPEVWILSRAINRYYIDDYVKTGCLKTDSHGKYLIIKDIKEKWSFGITGKVLITDNNTLTKLNTGWVYGEQVNFIDYNETGKQIGLDWMRSPRELLEQEVDKWIKSKKKIAELILDQLRISGIGTIWGSEILFKSYLRPDMRACDQVLNKLVDVMIYFREKIQEVYDKEMEEYNDNLKEFINEWDSNLYDLIEMDIYKKGSQIKVQGNNWWV